MLVGGGSLIRDHDLFAAAIMPRRFGRVKRDAQKKTAPRTSRCGVFWSFAELCKEVGQISQICPAMLPIIPDPFRGQVFCA